ncbi:hypothetical protein AMECASPLE_035132 [Ameca splendens]|uniref:Uncharacterized protein n=1 Tax=Ameca splendens TaxID=208324 RepID=A0ABV0XWS0_9TELE
MNSIVPPPPHYAVLLSNNDCLESFTCFSTITCNDLATFIGKTKPSSCLELLPPSMLSGCLTSVGPLLSVIKSSLTQSFNPSYCWRKPLTSPGGSYILEARLIDSKIITRELNVIIQAVLDQKKVY